MKRRIMSILLYIIIPLIIIILIQHYIAFIYILFGDNVLIHFVAFALFAIVSVYPGSLYINYLLRR